MTDLDAAAIANETFRAKHGYEDPDYLGRMLTSAHRQADAARAVVGDVHKRLTAAWRAEWDGIYDAEIMNSEHLRTRLAKMAHRSGTETGLYDRLQRLLPKAPAALPCSEGVDGDANNNPLPTLQLFLPFEVEDWSYTKSAPDLETVLAAQAGAIKEIGRLWSCGRRLIKVATCIPGAPSRWKLWIEYEPATGRARLMEANGASDATQLMYGDLPDALISAEQTARIWKDAP
jgi:hypothetical protein